MIVFEIFGLQGYFTAGEFSVPNRSVLAERLEAMLQGAFFVEMEHGSFQHLGSIATALRILREEGATIISTSPIPNAIGIDY